MSKSKKKAGSKKPTKRYAKGSSASPRKQSYAAVEKVLRAAASKTRPRQQRLPGVEEDPGSKRIDHAAYDYVEARDARMATTTVENQRATKLIAVVKQERPGQTTYKHTVGGEVLTVQLTVKDPTEKVKVKITSVDETAIGEGGDAAPEGDVAAMDADDDDESAGVH